MTITFDLLAGEIKTPTVAVETDLVSGRTGLPELNKKLLLLGYMTSAGSATVGEVANVTTTKLAIDLYGIGSQLAIMVEAALKVSPRLDIWCQPYTESAGDSAANTMVLATAATGSGVWTIHIAGRQFRVPIESGDAIADIGAAAVVLINAHHNLPVTASFLTDTLTLTARNAGTSGNTIRYRSEITPGIGTTVTNTAATLASGTLEGTLSTELAKIEAQRFHIAALNTDDDTVAGELEDHIDTQSSPTAQKWMHGVLPAVSTGTNAGADATARDSYRMNVVWHQNSDQPNFELSAAYGAERARVVQRNRTLNYHELPGITAQYDEAVWPTPSEIETALGNGYVALRPLRTGGVEITRNVHTRVTSPAFIDSEPMEISDFIDEDLIDVFKNRFSDSALKVSSPAGTPRVLTPARAKLALHERMRLWDKVLDYTQGAETDIENGATQAEQNASDVTRLDVAYPFRPVFGAHVIAILKTFTTPSF